MSLPKLTESVIRAGAGERSFERGLALYRGGAICRAEIQGNTLNGECEGTSSPFYRVRVELDKGGVLSANCTCPYEYGGYCKHTLALLLLYAHKPEQFIARKATAEILSDISREQLIYLMTKLLDRSPDLRDWLEAEIALPAASGKGKTKSAKKKIDRSIYRRRVRSIMHSLDNMRMSEAYWHVGGLVSDLRGVEQAAMEFLNAGDPEAAFEILLAILEEAHDGFDYIDDSNGGLGDFLLSLGETMAEVILSLDGERREKTLAKLEPLHRKLSDYGVEGLSLAIAAARYGWNDLPESKPARRAYADEEDEEYEDEWDEDDADEWDEDEVSFGAGRFDRYGSEWSDDVFEPDLTRAKLNVLERQGRLDDYLELCLQTGAHLRYALKLCALDRAKEAVAHALNHLSHTSDALKLAEHLRETGNLDDAIRVGEHGLTLDGHKASLGEWLAPIEEAQGRAAQALDAWLVAFDEKPSLDLYKTIKRLAGKKWNNLLPDLKDTLEKSWNKQPLAEALLFEQEWDAAIKVADQNSAYYKVIALVADAVIAHRPEWVIRKSVKQAEDLIAQTQSKYYAIAADWLRKTKAAYAQLGKTAEWKEYLQNLKDQYKRRPALQAQLAKL